MAGARPTAKLGEIVAAAQLPALPQSAIRLLELSRDPDNGPAEFAQPIEADPGLAGQVLRFVNSSYFGFSREISSVKHAITLVGVKTIKNFALWSAVFSLMPNPKCGPFDLKSLWQDSFRRGLFARRMGKLLGVKDGEDLFTAALLQDMAVPLLAKELPGDYRELLEGREDGRLRLSDLERERFGWTHADAAGEIARKWRLPEQFSHLVEGHVQVDELLARQDDLPRLTVGLSALLPAAHDPVWTERDRFRDAWEQLRLAAAPPLESVLAEVDQEFADFAPLLKLSRPPRTLVECCEEASEPAAV